MNALLRAKDRRHGNLAALTEGDIEIVFRETQEARHARAHLVVKDAHDTQALFAWENTVLSTFVFKLTQPVFGGEAIVDLMSSVIMGASKVDKLPVPPRRHIIPWHDELPAKPVDARTHDLVRKAFLSVMALIVIIGLKPLQLPIPELERWSKSAVGLRWFGDNAINDFFNMLVGVLVVPVEGGGISTNVQLWNFIPQLISPLMIWGIEGYRAGHRATPLALPALYSVLMQVQGIGRVAPIYAALSSFFTHDTPLGRTIPRNVADSLIPAITLGFTIPTLMALTPNPNVSAWHGWNLIWQASPPLFNFLLSLGATGLGWWRGRGQTEAKKPKKEPAPPRSGHDFVPALKTAYSYAFAVQATTHIASVAYGWHHPDVNLATIFFGLLSPFSDNWGLPTVGATMSAVLKYDMFLAMAAFLGSNLYSIWDLRRLGYVRTRESVKAALLLVAGQLVVGPGASWAGLWYWREGKIAAASKEN